MGRSYTPAYVVETTENFGRKQVMAWSKPVCGEKKLREWLDTYNASFQKGGNNFHVSESVGYIVTASRAVLRRNLPGAAPITTVSPAMFELM